MIPEEFLAGPHPLRIPGKLRHESLPTLLNARIDTFIDLTDPSELLGSSYMDLIMKMPESDNIRYFNYPVREFGNFTNESMREILDLIYELRDEKRHLYLHCYGGIGRTGAVVCCFLIEQGLTAIQALEEIKVLRKNISRKWLPSPETDAQIQFVLEWQRPETIS